MIMGLTTKLLIASVLVAALIGGIARWEHNIREDAIAQERARVALASAELQRTEAIKAADNVAQSEREASTHEEEMAHKDRAIEEANRKIDDLERSSKCAVSRATVRKLNSLR